MGKAKGNEVIGNRCIHYSILFDNILGNCLCPVQGERSHRLGPNHVYFWCRSTICHIVTEPRHVYVQGKPGGPRLLPALISLLKKQFIVGFSVSVTQGLLSTIARPLILRVIIDKVARDVIELDEAALLLVLLAVVVFVEGVFGVLYRHLLTDDMGTTFITAMFSLTMTKVMQNSPAQSTRGAGQTPDSRSVRDGVSAKKRQSDDEGKDLNVINLFGNDILRRFRDLLIASNMPMACASFMGGTGTIIYLLGWQSALVRVFHLCCERSVHPVYIHKIGTCVVICGALLRDLMNYSRMLSITLGLYKLRISLISEKSILC